ncbi:MAG: hypothetical protein L3J16_04265 [Anaerolineales bacterium]|nr:hypothetical protein [Anaerolineales bacterium]
MKKQRRWVEFFLVVAVMGGAFYAAFSDAHNFPNRWFTRDDAYYYFKVAQNISEGLGSTFDGVNLANGYHPLWMLVCIPIFSLARFDLILPLRILVLVMGALGAATSVLLYRLVLRVLSKTAAVLIAAFWGLSLYVHATVIQFGLETGITVFSLVLFLSLFEKFERKWRAQPSSLKEIAGLGLVGVLVLFSRLDTVFLLLAFGLYIVFRALPLRYFLLLDILGIVWGSFASFVFRVGMKGYYTYAEAAIVLTLLSLLISLPLYYFFGLYQHPRSETFRSLAKRILLSVSFATGLASVLVLSLSRLGLLGAVSGSVLLIHLVLSLLWVSLTRFSVRLFSAPRTREFISPRHLFQEKWKTWFNEGLAYYSILGGALGFYMLFNKFVFGTSSPVSGQIKRWWGSLPGNVYGGPARRKYTFWGFDTSGDSDVNAWGLATKFVSWLQDALARWTGYSDKADAIWPVFFAVAIVVLLILIASRKRTLRTSVHFGLLPLLAGSVVQVIYYNATGYSAAKEWYWVGQLVFTFLLAALLLDVFFRALRRIHSLGRYLTWAGTAILVVVWGQAYYAHIVSLMPYGVEHDGHPYMDILTVVEASTEPEALIGMTGGGNLGYFINDRTIVNMDGLINSYDYFLAHQAGRADDYLAAMGLDYVFVNPILLADIPYKGEFDGRLGEPLAYFRKKAVIPFYAQEQP